MNLLEHLAATLAERLREDPRAVLLGEDVQDGGMLGLSKVAAGDPKLASRLLGTPLSPTTALAYAGGLALGGARPIVLASSALGLVEGLAGLRECGAAEQRLGQGVPVLIVAPCGPGFGTGVDATEGVEGIVARVPGVRVVALGRAEEGPGVLRAAAEFWAGEAPTVLLLPRRSCGRRVEPEHLVSSLGRPFAAPHVVHEGDRATVFAWGETVELVQSLVAHHGLDVAVMDVECLSPLGEDALVAQLQRTRGRAVVVHAGPRPHGLGAEVAALLADRALLHLDAPLLRVCGGAPSVLPANEATALPSTAAILEAIDRVVTY